MSADSPWSQGPSSFPETRLTVLDRIRSDEPEVRREAFGDLSVGYWRPIYTYLRLKWNQSADDAKDLTQGFLATAYEKRYFESFEPAKARFRTFLRTCVDRYVMNEQKAARRVKRGGEYQFVALDFETAEGEIRTREPSDPVDTEAFFRQEYVRALFSRTVDQVRDILEAEGKGVYFAIFERYDLGPAESVSYADLAEEFGLTVSRVTNYLARVRREFRRLVLYNLKLTSGTDDDYRAEARELFGIEVE